MYETKGYSYVCGISYPLQLSEKQPSEKQPNRLRPIKAK